MALGLILAVICFTATVQARDIMTKDKEYLVSTAVLATQFQAKLNEIMKQKYIMTLVDAYTVNGEIFFNTVWKKHKEEIDWRFFFGDNYQAFDRHYKDMINKKYRLKHVDTYLQTGRLLYTAIFYKDKARAGKAYYGVTLLEHKDKFTRNRDDGYRMTLQNIVTHAGHTKVSAIYTKDATLDIVAPYGIDTATLFTGSNTQKNEKRALTYINAYETGLGYKFSAIYTKPGPSDWTLESGLSITKLEQLLQEKAKSNEVAVHITGYESAGTTKAALFAAVWLPEVTAMKEFLSESGQQSGGNIVGGRRSASSVIQSSSIVTFLFLIVSVFLYL